MQTVNYPVACESCGHENKLQVDLFTGKSKQLKTIGQDFDFKTKWALVTHYKKLKGFDQIPTWDRSNRGRAIKAATQILHFFSAVADPVDVAKECMDDVAKNSKISGFPWVMETVLKRAPDWLLEKQKGAR